MPKNVKLRDQHPNMGAETNVSSPILIINNQDDD